MMSIINAKIERNGQEVHSLQVPADGNWKSLISAVALLRKDINSFLTTLVEAEKMASSQNTGSHVEDEDDCDEEDEDDEPPDAVSNKKQKLR